MQKLPKRAKKVEGVNAPMPYLCEGLPYNSFLALRQFVLQQTGHDFLSVCGDMMRSRDFMSSKDGVANRSWHKTGRAFDYNQEDKNFVLVKEQIGRYTYFRTYIRCNIVPVQEEDFALEKSSPDEVTINTKQLGEKMTLHTTSGLTITNYFFDFTAAAEKVGYKRIPAWKGWESRYNRREFWHYQCDENLSWQEAMDYFYGEGEVKLEKSLSASDSLYTIPAERYIGRNDRGLAVTQLQTALAGLGYLSLKEVDGIFGNLTHWALVKFQEAMKLRADGIYGPKTRLALEHLQREAADEAKKQLIIT